LSISPSVDIAFAGHAASAAVSSIGELDMIKKHCALVAFLGLILVSQVNANPPPGKGGGQSGQATSG
jgi:hypothetical protein